MATESFLSLPVHSRVVRRGSTLSVVLASLLVAGCTSPSASVELETNGGGLVRPIVVAVFDGGVNPYHDVFQSQLGRLEATQFGATFGAETLTLSTAGSLQERLDADAESLSNVQERQLYAFSGTRILAIGFGGPVTGHPVLDEIEGSGHGTATSSVIANIAPDVLILSVKINSGRICPTSSDCELLPVMAEAMQWVAAQPWIDIVSVSIGTHGNPPMRAPLRAEAEHYIEATRDATRSGKIVVHAAGNAAVPALLSPYGGPPWIIAVGGYSPEEGGEAIEAAKGADVIANFSARTASHLDTSSYSTSYGTSFSAPTVAGTLAVALGALPAEMSCASPRTTALRDAMNATAVGVESTEWSPRPGTDVRTLHPSLPVVAPGLQAGWGLVMPELAQRIAEAAVRCEDGPSAKPGLAPTMQALQDLRTATWP